MMGLFLDVNTLVFALMIAGVFVHEATAYWDVAYAEGRREVTPSEQHVHSISAAVKTAMIRIWGWPWNEKTRSGMSSTPQALDLLYHGCPESATYLQTHIGQIHIFMHIEIRTSLY